jgi:hypothetical protein
VTSNAAMQLAARKGVPVQWDSAAREAFFSYTDTLSDPQTTCQVSHTVRFSDARAVVERARLADTYGLAGVAQWTVGGEDPAQWQLLRVLSANPWDPRVAPQEVLEAFVRHGYEDLLGRGPDPGGLLNWTSGLRSGAVTQGGFIRSLIFSQEGAQRTVAQLYQQILQRPPDPAGLAGWSTSIASGRVTTKDARVLFWTSPERISRAGGITQWVKDLYTVELGRTADPGGLGGWSSTVQHQGYAVAARGIIGSQEWAQRQVAAQYSLMLKRGPDPAGLASWTSVVDRTDVPDLQVGLGSSIEYFQRGS